MKTLQQYLDDNPDMRECLEFYIMSWLLQYGDDIIIEVVDSDARKIEVYAKHQAANYEACGERYFGKSMQKLYIAICFIPKKDSVDVREMLLRRSR